MCSLPACPSDSAYPTISVPLMYSYLYTCMLFVYSLCTSKNSPPCTTISLFAYMRCGHPVTYIISLPRFSQIIPLVGSHPRTLTSRSNLQLIQANPGSRVVYPRTQSQIQQPGKALSIGDSCRVFKDGVLLIVVSDAGWDGSSCLFKPDLGYTV